HGALRYLSRPSRRSLAHRTDQSSCVAECTSSTEPPACRHNHEVNGMSNDLMIPSNDDGWADAAAEAAERVIKGTLLKFADGQWSKGKEATAVPVGTQLVALGVTAAWVKWFDQKPVEYRMRQPGTRLPDREELPDQEESDWQVGPDDKTRR